MNLNTKVRLLQSFNHIVSIPAIGYAIYIDQYHWFAIAFISWFFIGPVSMVITMHRLLTHRSFKTYPWLERILTFLTTFSTVGPTISWVALHRMHHATSDRVGDPHSPNKDSKISFVESVKVWFGYDWKIPIIPVAYVKDLMRDGLHRWIFRNYFKIIFSLSIILILINPMIWLFVYVVPASMTVHLIGVVNVFGHSHGYRNHETKDCSTNSWIANIVSLGDGWHNNHHANPNNFYAGEKWWEWDLMGGIIKILRIS